MGCVWEAEGQVGLSGAVGQQGGSVGGVSECGTEEMRETKPRLSESLLGHGPTQATGENKRVTAPP